MILQLSPRDMDCTPLGLGTPLAIGTRATPQRRPVQRSPSEGQHMLEGPRRLGTYPALLGS